VALGSHWDRNPLAINKLWGGFEVALGGFAPSFCILHSAFYLRPIVALDGFAQPLSGFSFQLSAFQHLPKCGFAQLFEVRSSRFKVRGSAFTISALNTIPFSRLPRGGLGALWYHPGTILYP